jgi:hypothetical protein
MIVGMLQMLECVIDEMLSSYHVGLHTRGYVSWLGLSFTATLSCCGIISWLGL